jgi:DNA gyrase subunit A
VKLRARYDYDKKNGCIEILQIPYSTSIEAILGKITELVKEGKLKEITDFRDEIDLNGFKLTLDLKRGSDPDQVMAKLYKLTPLEDRFSCNFNVLIDGAPRQLGVAGILTEWIRFRIGCLKRELTFELGKKRDKMHLLRALGKILLDIDKAIRIIRNTKAEADVVPNLMEGFSIDEIQANYIAEIKLRHLNREYIMNKIKEIEELQKKIAETEEILADELKQKQLIIDELNGIKKKYGRPRKTDIVNHDEVEVFNEKNFVEQYNARFVLTRDGYFKKITFASLRGNDEQTLKEGDVIISMFDSDNNAELIFFTNMGQIYRIRAAEFGVCKASVMGEYLPSVLKMENGEKPVCMMDVREYPETDYFVYFFENGKGVRIPMSAYETKGARKKLTSAFYSDCAIVGIFRQKGKADESKEVILVSSDQKAIVLPFSAVEIKSTKKSRGTQLFTLKKGATLTAASENVSAYVESTKGYKKYKLPAAGTALGK